MKLPSFIIITKSPIGFTSLNIPSIYGGDYGYLRIDVTAPSVPASWVKYVSAFVGKAVLCIT